MNTFGLIIILLFFFFIFTFYGLDRSLYLLCALSDLMVNLSSILSLSSAFYKLNSWDLLAGRILLDSNIATSLNSEYYLFNMVLAWLRQPPQVNELILIILSSLRNFYIYSSSIAPFYHVFPRRYRIQPLARVGFSVVGYDMCLPISLSFNSLT